MLRIVIPFSAAALVDLISIAACIDVVLVEIVFVVDVHVTAAVPVAVAPAAAPRGAHCNAHSKSHHSVTRRISVRIRVDGRGAVNDGRAILRNVNNLRIRRLNHDYFFVLNCLRFDCLLRACLKIASSFRLGAHSLNGVHHVRLLSEKSISEIHHPGRVIAQLFDHIRKRSQRLNAWIVR